MLLSFYLGIVSSQIEFFECSILLSEKYSSAVVMVHFFIVLIVILSERVYSTATVCYIIGARITCDQKNCVFLWLNSNIHQITYSIPSFFCSLTRASITRHQGKSPDLEPLFSSRLLMESYSIGSFFRRVLSSTKPKIEV